MQILGLFVRTVNTALTSSDNTVALEAGYYDSITISTDITNIDGTITYAHHIHDLASNSAVEINSKLEKDSVEGGYEDSYIATTSGGCFTEPYYSYTYTTSTGCSASNNSSYTVYSSGSFDDEWGYTHYRSYAKCNKCGGTSPTYQCTGSAETSKSNCYWEVAHGTRAINHTSIKKTVNEEGTASKMPSTATNIQVIGYCFSCGHSNGEVLSATITY